MDRSVRYDVGGLGNAERTPQGFLRIPGNVTRIGVLTYHRADGSVFRELKSPDEVFRADSISSLAFCSVTDRHPSELVSPSNVAALQVGMVTDARQDGGFIRSDLIIQDARMIEKIERGDARELSAGYTCRVDETSGTFRGERYDGIQRDIVYNHVAIGPRDWGRAGPDVSLHLDGQPSEAFRSSLGVERFDDELAKLIAAFPEAARPIERSGGTEGVSEMEKIKIDGLEFEVEPILAATIRRAQEAHAANAATLQAKADSLEGERDAAKASAEELQAKLDAATDPSAISEAVRCRVALEASARKILGDEARLDGKTDREIKVDCLTHRDERFDASDRSDAYIDGRFDLLVETAPERRDSRDNVVRAVASVTSPVSKPAEERIDSADKARLASEKAWRELGRSPLRSARRA